MNVAGVVTEVGKGVTAFKVGDEVFGHFTPGDDRKAAFQLDSWLGKKPAGMSFEEVASLPIAYVAALGAVYSSLEIPVSYMPAPAEPFEPQSVLVSDPKVSSGFLVLSTEHQVLGGSSSLGTAAIQLLRLSPPDVGIITTCSAAHHARMSALGANRTFDRNAPLAEIIAVTPTKSGVDAVLGAVRGAVDRPEILSVLRKDGGDEVCRGHVGARHKGGS
ncbi:MAG: hypothetical protein MMC23_009058 [Stictis urceolatum]|nr:hypothetical protein [Stictis urceolata]